MKSLLLSFVVSIVFFNIGCEKKNSTNENHTEVKAIQIDPKDTKEVNRVCNKDIYEQSISELKFCLDNLVYTPNEIKNRFKDILITEKADKKKSLLLTDYINLDKLSNSFIERSFKIAIRKEFVGVIKKFSQLKDTSFVNNMYFPYVISQKKETDEVAPAIHAAINLKNLDLLKALLSYKDININQQDNRGRGAAHRLYMNENINIIKYLIENSNLDINQLNQNGSTLLIEASVYGNVNLVRYLSKLKNIKPNILDKHGDSALSRALTTHNGDPDITRALIEIPNINLDYRDDIGNNYIMLATRSSNYQQIIDLVDTGMFSLNDVNNNGQTALNIILSRIVVGSSLGSKEDEKTATILLKKQGNEISRNYEKNLCMSVRHGNLKFVKLIEKNNSSFDPNIECDYKYRKSLLVGEAACNDNSNVLQYLINHPKFNFSNSENTPRKYFEGEVKFMVPTYALACLERSRVLPNLKNLMLIVDSAGDLSFKNQYKAMVYYAFKNSKSYYEIYSDKKENIESNLFHIMEYIFNLTGIESLINLSETSIIKKVLLWGNLDLLKLMHNKFSQKIDFDNYITEISLFGWSVLSGDLEKVKYIHKINPDLISKKNYEDKNHLFLAISDVFRPKPEQGNFEVLEFLLNLGVLDVNERDYDRETPLIYAVFWNKINAVKILLNNDKVNITLKDKHGRTALDIAKEKGFHDIVDLLIEHSK